MSVIRFGTDGWRARMGRDFSFRNVRIFARAYGRLMRRRHPGRDLKIIVNFDTRFLSSQFAQETARLFSLMGIETMLPNRDAPLPAVALAVVQKNCLGAVNFTASFNKPIFNGIKVFNQAGAPAMPSETALIEDEIDRIAPHFTFKPRYANNALIGSVDVRTPYISYIEEVIDFSKIRSAGMSIVVDNLFGASRDYLDYLLSHNGIEIHSIHNFPYASFGGVVPSCDRDNLRDLAQTVRDRGADIGLATDIDGDRFGIVDTQGRFICANKIMPPLIEYLISVRKMDGGIVKSISTTDTINRVADYYLRKVHVTPVGFKYLADMMRRRRSFIGVESTNGASLNRTITIKDGILFNLLVLEMLAHHKLDLTRLFDHFYQKFPPLYNHEASMPKTSERASKLEELVQGRGDGPSGYPVRDVVKIDGVKYLFDDGWLLLRESGTHDVIRLYSEASTRKKAREMVRLGRMLLGQ